MFVVSVWFVALFFLHLAHSWKHWGCEEGPAEGLSNASGFAEGPGHLETAFGPAQGPSPMWKVNLALQKGQMQYRSVPGHHVVRAQVLHLLQCSQACMRCHKWICVAK